MAVNDNPSRLGCGRLVDDVWERLDRPPDAHERSCPFCTDARADLQRLALATRQLIETDAHDAGLQIGPQVKTAIMTIARSEVRRARRIPLEPPPAGEVEAPLSISEQAVVALVRAAADEIPGVRARRCNVEIDKATLRMAPSTLPPTAAGSRSPITLRVQLRVAVAAGTAIPSLVRQVRARVNRQVLRRVGISVSGVDVEVEDVYDA